MSISLSGIPEVVFLRVKRRIINFFSSGLIKFFHVVSKYYESVRDSFGTDSVIKIKKKL